MSNTVYQNEIIENKMTDLMNTKLKTKALMTIDETLAEKAGLRKVINRYTYTGAVENLAKGERNTVTGTVSFVPEYYDVKRYQQTFEYNDMDAMADPYILDVAMNGAAAEMANEINREYFSEIAKISSSFAYTGDTVTYADIVDALALVDCEVDSGLFMIMGAEDRKAIRKDSDFIASKQGEILYSGQFGTLCGIPVIFSKLAKPGVIYITNKDAVRFFIKKEASVEQDRDIETKDNTVVYERHGLVALVDDTNSVVIGKKAPDAPIAFGYGEGSNNKSTFEFTNASYAGSSVKYRVNSRLPFLDEDISDWEDADSENLTTPTPELNSTIVLAVLNEDGKTCKCAISCDCVPAEDDD